MENGRVSVIVPMYNNGHYVKECIDSILNQTYTNIEIIVINDGSDDNTELEIKRYENKVIFINQNNLGVSASRNRGIEIATGEYIVFIDGDDKLPNDAIHKLVQMAEIDSGIEIVIGTCIAFDENKRYSIKFFPHNRVINRNIDKRDLFYQLMDVGYLQESELICTAVGVPWAKLYKKDFLQKYELRFEEKLKRMQDNIFNMKAFFAAQSILYSNEVVYEYRIDHISSYSKPYDYRNLIEVSEERKKFVDLHKKYFEELELIGVYENERIHLMANCIKNILISYDADIAVNEINNVLAIFEDVNYNKLKNNIKDWIVIWCVQHRLRTVLSIILKTKMCLKNFWK